MLKICVYNVRGSRKIPRAMNKNWGKFCFEKGHYGSHLFLVCYIFFQE